MTDEEGEVVAQSALSAIAFAEEHYKSPGLIAVCVVLTVVDEEGEPQVVTHSWAR